MSWTRHIAAGRVSDLHQSFILGASQARYHAGVSTERLSQLFAQQRADMDRHFTAAHKLMDAGKHQEARDLLSGLMTRMAKEPGPVSTFYAEQAAAVAAKSTAAGTATTAALTAPRWGGMRAGAPMIAMASIAAIGLAGAALYSASHRKRPETTRWADRVAAERANGQGQSVVR